ncbi:MAG: biopolymer transporter ExbD [Bacteroidota bacterium]
MEQETKEFRIIKRPRSKKLNPSIDMSSMVSISFLLIIFFMVTIELARPQMMDFGLPESSCGPSFGGCNKPDEKRVITLLLDDDDEIISYWGLLEVPNEKPKKLAYGKDGIRKELIAKNNLIKKYMLERGITDRATMVIIKPSKKCNYGNLVDILDEMAITNIGTYAIINDYTPEESILLASK